jgi:hypothetical protein
MAENSLQAKAAKKLGHGFKAEHIESAAEYDNGDLVVVTKFGQKVKIGGDGSVDLLAGPAVARDLEVTSMPAAVEEQVGPDATLEEIRDAAADQVPVYVGGDLAATVSDPIDFKPTKESQPQPAPGGVSLPDESPEGGSDDPEPERVVDPGGDPIEDLPDAIDEAGASTSVETEAVEVGAEIEEKNAKPSKSKAKK